MEVTRHALHPYLLAQMKPDVEARVAIGSDAPNRTDSQNIDRYTRQQSPSKHAREKARRQGKQTAAPDFLRQAYLCNKNIKEDGDKLRCPALDFVVALLQVSRRVLMNQTTTDNVRSFRIMVAMYQHT
eukprot:scaffold648024_cov48-Prasinocladus_malaysianus.AAC.1